MMRRRLSILAMLAIGLGATDAAADCAADFEEAQRLRNAGRLLSAEEHAGACAAVSCPAWMQAKCSGLLDELRGRVPSIVVRATDGTGRDIEHASLALDGKAVASGINGRPIRVDPGAHSLQMTGACSIEERIVVAEGDHDRIVTLACPARPAPAEAGVKETASPPQRTRLTSFVVGGIGLVALGLGTYFGIRAIDTSASIHETCPGPPTCYAGDPLWQQASSFRDSSITYANVADVALAVGIIGVAVGTFLFVHSSAASPQTSAARTPR
jgi:serine/threonine-protein kinase